MPEFLATDALLLGELWGGQNYRSYSGFPDPQIMQFGANRSVLREFPRSPDRPSRAGLDGRLISASLEVQALGVADIDGLQLRMVTMRRRNSSIRSTGGP